MAKKLRRFFASALAALTVSVGMAAPANADVDNMVIFGDSVIADPPSFQYFTSRVTAILRDFNLGANDCPHSMTSYGEQAAARLGLQSRNYSCAGAVSISKGPQVADQVSSALADGSLTPATRRVIIATGLNDTYNNRGASADWIRGAYVGSMSPQIDRIRAAAPNARIQVLGYPTISMGGQVCLTHVLPDFALPTHNQDVAYWEWLGEVMNQDLARATGVEFLDLKTPTANNGTCARDSERYWAGLIDFTAGPGNMPIHLNARGHEAVGAMVAAS